MLWMRSGRLLKKGSGDSVSSAGTFPSCVHPRRLPELLVPAHDVKTPQ